jgi:hypothetical protein
LLFFSCTLNGILRREKKLNTELQQKGLKTRENGMGNKRTEGEKEEKEEEDHTREEKNLVPKTLG